MLVHVLLNFLGTIRIIHHHEYYHHVVLFLQCNHQYCYLLLLLSMFLF